MSLRGALVYAALRGALVYEALRGTLVYEALRGALVYVALRGALVYAALRRKAVFRYVSRRIQVCVFRYVYAGMCRGALGASHCLTRCGSSQSSGSLMANALLTRCV